jgi:O-antigen/teichoic acid export membrane protein
MLAFLKNKKILYIFIGYLPLSISFILTPIYTHYLPVKDYGFFNLYNSLIGIIAPLLHIGVKDGFGFLYWKTKGEETTRTFFSKTMGSMFVLQLSTFLFVILFGRLLLSNFFNFINDEEYKDYFFILVFYAFFLNFNDLLFYFYRNEDNLKGFVFLNVSSTLLMTIGSIIGIIVLNEGIKGAIYGRAIGFIIVVIGFIVKHINEIVFQFKFTKIVFSAGLPILVSSILGSYSGNLDKYFLQKNFELSFMAKYGIALTIMYVVDVFLVSIFHFSMPETIKKLKDGINKHEIQNSINEIFVVFLLFLLLVVGISPYFIKLFPKNYSETLLYLPFLALNPIIKFYGSFNTLSFYLYDKSTVFFKHHLIVLD